MSSICNRIEKWYSVDVLDNKYNYFGILISSLHGRYFPWKVISSVLTYKSLHDLIYILVKL